MTRAGPVSAWAVGTKGAELLGILAKAKRLSVLKGFLDNAGQGGTLLGTYTPFHLLRTHLPGVLDLGALQQGLQLDPQADSH